MNIIEQFRCDEQGVLDRLVDNELTSADRRALLAALDDEPGAWRRCALAFVETQQWSGQLARWQCEPTARSMDTNASSSAALRRSTTLWSVCLGIAASLMVAFYLGTQFSRRNAAAVARNEQSARPLGEPSNAQPATTVAESSEEIPEANSGQGALGETITLAFGDEGEEEELSLPLVEADESGAEALAEQKSALPDELVDQLEQAGLQVTRHRRLYPLELSDGRRVVVPIEEVDIHSPGSLQL